LETINKNFEVFNEQVSKSNDKSSKETSETVKENDPTLSLESKSLKLNKDKILQKKRKREDFIEKSIETIFETRNEKDEKLKKLKIHKIKKIKHIDNSNSETGDHYLESEKNMPIKIELEKYSPFFGQELTETLQDEKHKFMYEHFPSMYKIENYYIHIKKQRKRIGINNSKKFEAKIKNLPFTNYLENSYQDTIFDNKEQCKKVWDSKVLDPKEGKDIFN
jgi:hypothetical protein